MPKVVDREVRRAEVVAATWQVIADEGLEAATVRRIAAAAGCTTGRVTHHFASKDDVLVAALGAVHAAAAARMARVVADAGDGPAEPTLRAVLLEALPVDDERRREWGVWLAFWGRASTDDRLSSEHVRRYEAWRGLLATLVAPIVGARPGSAAVRSAVDLVASSVDGLGIQALLQPDRLPPRRLAAMVDLLVDAIRPR